MTRAQQATYLKRAYAYVRRYPQVRVLLWFLLHDSPPAPGRPPELGIYSGLRDPDGTRNPPGTRSGTCRKKRHPRDIETP